MSRNFDGTDDNVDFGSDASIDDFTAWSVAFWIDLQTPSSTYDVIVDKGYNGSTVGKRPMSSSTFSGFMEIEVGWSGGRGYWGFPKPTNGRHHMVWTYDGASASNVPLGYLNGVAQTTTTGATPSGTLGSDAASSLRIGETNGGGQDFVGKLEHFVYVDRIITAAEVNRHRWWGRPSGAMKVCHPMVTDKLGNEGSATADGTATGATVASLVTPVQRPGMGTAL